MKLIKTIFGIMLSICILSACLPTAAAENATPTGLWTDFAATSFAGGDGTEENPYQIETAEQLALLAKDVNSGAVSTSHTNEFFILTNDIDLSEHVWTPLGYESYGSGSSQSFYGHFNGNGHKITGLYVDQRGKNRSAGLFGQIAAVNSTPVIENLTVENGTVYAGDSFDSTAVQYGAGILVGNISILGGSSVQYAVIKNCSVSGTVSSYMYAGGLIGNASYTHFENCSADVKVKGTCGAGGFVGNAFQSEFTDCKANGNVSGGWSIGGFAGILFYNTKVTRCAAFGDIEANDWNIGGFVGYSEENVSIKNSIATGDVKSDVTGWDPKAGGFAGSAFASTAIENCHAAGKVTFGIAGSVGGMIAYAEESSSANCSFDSEKNANIPAVGTIYSGTYAISTETGEKVLENICEDYYGGHDTVEVPKVDATCTENGTEAGVKCTRCSYKTGFETINATGHDYENGVCKNCSAECSHEGGDATCINKAVCEICGTEYGETNSENHTEIKHIPAKAATEESEGNIEYWQCDGCKKCFADPDATEEISEESTVIAQINNSKDSEDNSGKTDKNDGEKPPKTSDNTLALWIALMLISGTAGAAAVGKKIKIK